MARFCICWLACCSLLLPCPARAESPISADFFLQSIEPAPSASMLYDFLDIYGNSFAECKETDTFLRALGYLAANGDTRTVRDRLKLLAACPELSEVSRQRLAALQAQVTAPKLPAEKQAPLKTMVETPPPKPVVDAVPQTIAPAPVQEMTEPAPAPTVSTAEAPATPPTVVVITESPVQVEATQPARPPKAKKVSVRRTSLPVTPTIPMHSRTVPPRVLAPNPSVQTEPQPVPQKTPEPSPVQVQPAKLEPTPSVAPAWRTEITSRIVYRTGTEGTSRLLRLENTASLGYGDWTFSATALYLNAGTAGSREFAGSYFRGSPQRSLLTEHTAFIPQIAYDSDTLDFSLSTSPLGGEVSPLPAFRLSYDFGNLKLAAFQESVTDSLLSYAGFRDPVTGQRMGRVMRAGARVGWDDTFAEYWFYGGALTGAYLYGENVKDNKQIRGEFYVGRSLGEVLGGKLAAGSYSAIDHYSTNLNNYTFGHGGYYSPYIAATSVLFFSWEYAGEAGRLKADISSGFLYEKTRDTSLYFRVDGPDVPDGVYEGETHRRITVNAGLEGSLNLTEDLTLNASTRVINSGDFTEARGGLYLKLAF